MHLVLATNAEVDQPWLAEATARFALQAGATVAVVSVDEVELERLAAAPRSVSLQQAERAGAAAVERLAAAGVTATSTVLSGAARDRILDFAESQQADVVVVGASGRPALATRLLGSVPLALVARSTRPVLVVTPPREGS
ncbi:MAG TPA: universal stress protein [Mycobacteriales bacterium]|jgi:nucleotide-binding universal stress UspA family protein|nr:universal stress protein [Mycobacteriales bacterium]